MFFINVITTIKCFIIQDNNNLEKFIASKGFRFLAVLDYSLDSKEVLDLNTQINDFTLKANALYYKITFGISTTDFLRKINRKVPLEQGIYTLDKNSKYIKCDKCHSLNTGLNNFNEQLKVELFEFLEESKIKHLDNCDLSTFNNLSNFFYLVQDNILDNSHNVSESLEKNIIYREIKGLKENNDFYELRNPYFMKKMLLFIYTKSEENQQRLEMLNQSENFNLYYHVITSSQESFIKYFDIEENGYEAIVLSLKYENVENGVFYNNDLIHETFKFDSENAEFLESQLILYYNSPVGTLNHFTDKQIKSGVPTAIILTENSFKEDMVNYKEITKAAILERKNVSVIAVDNLKKMKYDNFKSYLEEEQQRNNQSSNSTDGNINNIDSTSKNELILSRFKENQSFFNKYLRFYLHVFDVKISELPLLLIIKSEVVTENNKEISRLVRYKKNLKKKIGQVEFSYMINLSNCQDSQRFYKVEKDEKEEDIETNLNEYISNISNLESMMHEDKIKTDTYTKEEFEEFKNTAIEMSKYTKSLISQSFGLIMNIEQTNTNNLYKEISPVKFTYYSLKNKQEEERAEIQLQQKHYKKFYDKIEDKSKPIFKILMICGTSYECTNLSLILTYFKLNFITKKYEFFNNRYPELIPSLDLNYEFDQIKIYKFNPNKNEHVDLKFKNTPSIFLINPLAKNDNIKVFSKEIISKIIKRKKLKPNNKSEFSLDEDKTRDEEYILVDKNQILEQLNLEAKSFFEKAIKNLNKDELEKEDKKLLQFTDNKLRAKVDFNKIDWRIVHHYTRSFNEFLSVTELDFDMDDSINKNYDYAISDMQVSILNRKVEKKDEHNTLDDDEEGYKEGMNKSPQVDHTEVFKTFEYPALAILKLVFQNYNNFKKKLRTHIVNFANDVKVKPFQFGFSEDFTTKEDIFTFVDTNINELEKNLNLKNELIEKLSKRYNEMLNNLASDVQSYLATFVDLEGLTEIKRKKEEQAEKEKQQMESNKHESEDL